MPNFSFKDISIKAVQACVPQNCVSLDSLSRHFDKSTIDSFYASSGISKFRRALPLQTSSDLAFTSAIKILESAGIQPDEIGAIIFVSTSPDYRSPATACVLQHRLSIPKDCVAFDVNIGGAGFAYAIQIGASLLNCLNTNYVLITVGDTPSKQTSTSDLSSYCYTDAGSAILLERKAGSAAIDIEAATYSTYFTAAMIAAGGFRNTFASTDQLVLDYQNINKFVEQELATTLNAFAKKREGLNVYDYIAIPQLSASQVKQIRETLQLSPQSRLLNNYINNGDARGSSVALLLNFLPVDVEGSKHHRILSCTFGEGFSLGVVDFSIAPGAVLPVLESDEYFLDGAVSHNF